MFSTVCPPLTVFIESIRSFSVCSRWLRDISGSFFYFYTLTSSEETIMKLTFLEFLCFWLRGGGGGACMRCHRGTLHVLVISFGETKSPATNERTVSLDVRRSSGISPSSSKQHKKLRSAEKPSAAEAQMVKFRTLAS